LGPPRFSFSWAGPCAPCFPLPLSLSLAAIGPHPPAGPPFSPTPAWRVAHDHRGRVWSPAAPPLPHRPRRVRTPLLTPFLHLVCTEPSPLPCTPSPPLPALPPFSFSARREHLPCPLGLLSTLTARASPKSLEIVVGHQSSLEHRRRAAHFLRRSVATSPW
jgi:hypothetical protein